MDKKIRKEVARRINKGEVKGGDGIVLLLINEYKLNFCFYCENFTAEEECCGAKTSNLKNNIEG